MSPIKWKDAITKERKIYPEKDKHIFYRTSTHETRKGPQNVVCVRIGKMLVKEIGWKVGTCLKVLQDSDMLTHLALTESDEGYMTGPSVIPPDRVYSDMKGEIRRMAMTAPLHDEIPLPRTGGLTVKVVDFQINKEENKITFKLPHDISYYE